MQIEHSETNKVVLLLCDERLWYSYIAENCLEPTDTSAASLQEKFVS